MKRRVKTKAQLEREIKELESQLIHTYHFADVSINKVDTERLMG